MNYLGKEKGFYQTEWQNISFYDLNIKLTSDLPSPEFYTKFYDLLFKKYSNFESLPEKWVLGKKKSADNIYKLINRRDNVLSYGCGLGYIEHLLLKRNIKLSVFDFASNASKWLFRNNDNIYKYNELVDSYDVIYLSQVLYAVPYSDCVKLIKKLKTSLNENGRIIIIHSSIKPLENGINFKNFIKVLKSFIRPIYYLLNSKKKIENKRGQFWGWLRDNKMYIKLVKESNMKVMKIFKPKNYSGECYIVIKK